jgi:hypothetical protein
MAGVHVIHVQRSIGGPDDSRNAPVADRRRCSGPMEGIHATGVANLLGSQSGQCIGVGALWMDFANQQVTPVAKLDRVRIGRALSALMYFNLVIRKISGIAWLLRM